MIATRLPASKLDLASTATPKILNLATAAQRVLLRCRIDRRVEPESTVS
jgi:hypothetical protein